MKPLSSRLGQNWLESLTLTDSLYAFDFDGTLAPIVASPSGAKMSEAVLRQLKLLSEVAKVAIISGRSVSDLKPRVPLPRAILIGNHGLEGVAVASSSLSSAQAVCQDWQQKLEQAGQTFLVKNSGCFIENKTYSLALHYRLSRNKKNARLKLLQLGAALDPSPRVILGKSVINLIPPGGPHKGVALLEAMSQLGCKSAFYIGDDDTDEDVFSLPDSGVLTVRVGKKKGSSAQFYIERQAEIAQTLKKLNTWLRTRTLED